VPRLEAIVINCREPATLASFYAELLGLAVSPEDAAAITAGTLGEDESVLLGSRDSLWGSKTGHSWLACEYASRDRRWAGRIAGL
jgi:catechol-2,3-dioxygenase